MHKTREVIEIPVVPAEVIEHVLMARQCPVCNQPKVPKMELEGTVSGEQRLGGNLVSLIDPFQDGVQVGAIDSTPLAALGGVWHKKHREAGIMPHTSIDTEAHWTHSGWHGWVYGWKLHLITAVASVWIPLVAELTPANIADNIQALSLLEHIPAQIRYLLADKAYNDPELHERCEAQGRFLITSKSGSYPHNDEGVEVRRIFHELRSRAIENFNGQFKAIFGCLGQVPTRGLIATRRYVLVQDQATFSRISDMFFWLTPEMIVDPPGQFLGGERSVWLRYLSLGMDPARLNRVQPGGS